VVYSLHACSFATQHREKCSPMYRIGCAFRLSEAQNNRASIRKPLAMGYNNQINSVAQTEPSGRGAQNHINIQATYLAVYHGA
jgi:hypothetical protein